MDQQLEASACLAVKENSRDFGKNKKAPGMDCVSNKAVRKAPRMLTDIRLKRFRKDRSTINSTEMTVAIDQ